MDLPEATMPGGAPARLGKYDIRGTLGRGAMGIVHDGWDPIIGRRVAIKTVPLLDQADPDAQAGLERFKREAQAAGRLSHPNIVGVYDYGETDTVAFIVMEFVEGQSLKERLDAGERFPVAETVRIMEQVLAGLQFSHAAGVIHRDIKPGNIMLTRDGRVKLADFGIARIESSTMTQDGSILGTPAYMSPEQLTAQNVDARSDLYAAGVVLYQMLAGERPFNGGLAAITHKALNTVPPRPSDISVAAPPALDSVVACAMSRRPSDRYASATVFARALADAMSADGGSVTAAAKVTDDATAIVTSSRAAGSKATATAASSAPATTYSGGGRVALLAGGAMVVALLAAGGGWLALRRSGPAQPVPDSATAALHDAAPERRSEVAAAEPGTTRTPPAPAAATAVAPPSAPSAAPAAAPAVASPAVTAGPSPTVPTAPASAVAGAPPAAAVPSSAPTGMAAAVPIAPPPTSPTAADTPAPTPPRFDGSAIRTALTAFERETPCALLHATVSEAGQVEVAGLVGAGAPAEAARKGAQATGPSAGLSWSPKTVDGPYCEALDLIRPVAQTVGIPSALGLSLADGASRLRDHDPIDPTLQLPDFPAYLQVDYLSHDGSVTHLYPTKASADRPFTPGARISLRDQAKAAWEAGPPFGTDMILAVASSAPLFTPRRLADDDSARAYLPALQQAIENARRNGNHISGQAIAVETVAR